MPPTRIVVVVNPKAQNGALGRRWAELGSVVRRELGGFEEAVTEQPGDATRLAREAIEAGADTVVAVGGDGTINEVAGGFFDGDRPRTERAALAIIPFGTGGDFRKTVALPRDFAAAARVVGARNLRTIDVGHLRYTAHDGASRERVFVNIASFGMSGMVTEFANTSSKRLGGKLSFYLATAKAAVRYENRRVRLTFDGDVEGAVDMTIAAVAVANGRYFGGGMMVAPEAELDDGWFDVVAFGDFSKTAFFLSGHRLYRGTHLNMPKVSHRRARVVVAEPIDGLPAGLDVDGENPGGLPATFRVLPRALNLVVPGTP